MGDVIFAKNGVVYPWEVQNLSRRNAENSLNTKTSEVRRVNTLLSDQIWMLLERYESLVCVGMKITPIAYSSKKLWII